MRNKVSNNIKTKDKDSNYNILPNKRILIDKDKYLGLTKREYEEYRANVEAEYT